MVVASPPTLKKNKSQADLAAADFVMTDVLNFPESIYGAMMLAVVRTCQKHDDHIVLALLQVLGLFVNVALQFCVAFCIKVYVTYPAVEAARKVYAGFEKNITTTGMSPAASLANMSEEQRERLCQFPLSQPYFLWMILAIWTGYVMKDLRESVTYVSVWWGLPTPPVGSLVTTEWQTEHSKLVVRAAQISVKLIILFSTMIPKLIIATFVWWIGARWLVATTSFQDVVLNSVALAFIFDIDEMFYGALTALETRERVSHYCVDVVEPETEVASKAQFGRAAFMNACLLVIVLGIPILYIDYFQTVLPKYHWDLKGACDQQRAARGDEF